MTKKQIFRIVFSITAICLVSGFIVIGYSQQDQDSIKAKLAADNLNRRRIIAENGDPIGNFNEPLPTDPNELRIRKTRVSKFNSDAPPNVVLVKLNESMNDTEIFYNSGNRRLPAIPANTNFVAIGAVTGAKAFLSGDQVAIYSEFGFQVNQILKNKTGIQSGSNQIILTRFGGKVRFPSGRIIYQGLNGVYLPKTSRQYLMFLNYDAVSQSFDILTGYEFNNNHVIPLDGLTVLGQRAPGLEAYQKFAGMDINTFLDIVGTEINKN
jgi:hypothetical protein